MRGGGREVQSPTPGDSNRISCVGLGVPFWLELLGFLGRCCSHFCLCGEYPSFVSGVSSHHHRTLSHVA